EWLVFEGVGDEVMEDAGGTDMGPVGEELHAQQDHVGQEQSEEAVVFEEGDAQPIYVDENQSEEVVVLDSEGESNASLEEEAEAEGEIYIIPALENEEAQPTLSPSDLPITNPKYHLTISRTNPAPVSRNCHPPPISDQPTSALLASFKDALLNPTEIVEDILSDLTTLLESRGVKIDKRAEERGQSEVECVFTVVDEEFVDPELLKGVEWATEEEEEESEEVNNEEGVQEEGEEEDDEGWEDEAESETEEEFEFGEREVGENIGEEGNEWWQSRWSAIGTFKDYPDEDDDVVEVVDLEGEGEVIEVL
ncbi:hypothetical protein HDV05_002709, partial [Chytridiales sp. JEL 0842]